MKTTAILVTAMVLLTCGVFALDRGAGSSPAVAVCGVAPTISDEEEAAAPLIVHEWGTFTSFSGSDGVKLEFRPLVDNDLPGFVSSRFKQFGFYLGKSSLMSIQRMETPVTYFYTPVERDVTVKVEFPEGLLTEYYPPVRKVAPEFDRKLWTTGDNFRTPLQQPLSQTDSLLDWGRIHLIPTESLRVQVEDEELSRRIGRHVEPLLLPPAGNYPHYTAARVTDSAIVQFRQQAEKTADNPNPPATDYFEKFLFYRGIGNFDLPLTVTDNDDGSFELTNAGDTPIRSVFLVNVQADSVRFRRYDQSAADSQMSLSLPETETTLGALMESMVTSLAAEGLYEKEARAMVECWRTSWFGEDGTRVLYMVPTTTTDKLLPLHIEPQPDETVRILVGRIEMMPASQELQVRDLVTQSAQARERAGNHGGKFRSPVVDQLQPLGRFAEAALVRVMNVSEDEATRTEANFLRAEVRAKLSKAGKE